MIYGFYQVWGMGFGYMYIIFLFVVEIIVWLIAVLMNRNNNPNVSGRQTLALPVFENDDTAEWKPAKKQINNAANRLNNSQMLINNPKMKNETPGKKTQVSNQNSTFVPGSTMNKYPVVLDNGKTIIFISDKNKENEIRLKYEMHGQHTTAK